MSDGRITSVGYQGRTAEELAALLAAEGVATLVDVRLTPISRTPGFSKRRLAAVLEDVGVAYEHEPALGTPKEDRAAFQRGDGSEGRALVRTRLSEGEGHEALLRLVDRAEREHVAVLCLEHDPDRCHRQVVTTMAKELAPDLHVVELT